MKLYSICQCSLLLLLLLHCVAVIICENYYSVIAPGTIKSNRKYTVAVTLHDSNNPCTIRISILGHSYNASDEVHLQPFESAQLHFNPPKVEGNNYKLVAEGIKGCSFQNESQLLTETDAGPKIYIQTDKAVYKPEDLVQFRVVILDEHTRPLNISEPIRIEILDDEKNRVKQFKDISLTKGVYTGKFQLSQQPVMGIWEIKVVISGKYSYQKSKTISVRKYTLPKFNVHIKAPQNLLLENAHIKAIIYGKYTFDKYVEGNLIVELRSSNKNELLERKTLNIDGAVPIEFAIENTKKLSGSRYVSLLAELTEKHTGMQQSNKVFIEIRTQDYEIQIPDNEIEFRNNKPYRLKVHVRDWNGGAVLDRKTPVIMKHGKTDYRTYLNDDGVAIFEFVHQRDDGFTVMFKNSIGTLPAIYTNDDHDDLKSYCTLKLKDKPRLGKPVEIEVSSSNNLSYLVYTVVGHGSLVLMEQIKVPLNRKVYTISITPSIEMIPYSFVYVYYVHNGNFRYDEITLKFPKEFENEIAIMAPTQVKPGQEITLNVKAQPRSYVSVLAVDLSVYLLDASYDLSRDTILTDLLHDKSYIYNPYILSPGIISGLLTLTNAHHTVFHHGGFPHGSGGSQSHFKFRTKFPETWIFENFEINNTDTQIVLNIPDTITTWRITAFSNNDKTGFGIVKGPTDIITFLPFFITLNLPYSVKRGEVIAIVVLIFNYHNLSLDTNVVMFNNDLQYDFMEPSTNTSPNNEQDTSIKQVNVPADSSKAVTFLIKPKKVGEVDLRITAKNSVYSDGVERKLKVEPEGITKYGNQAIYLNDATGGTISNSLSVDIPHDTVSDSELITLSVGGDFMTPSLENLQALVKLPTGCGEQNMVNLAPNILIIEYLKATGKYRKEKKLVFTAKNYIDIGYQQELSYRHENGGYSVFGAKLDDVASTWLTAYVVRFFIKASKYTSIEARIIESGLDYLAREQLGDGRFPYTGYLFYTAHGNDYGFTAFVLLTFMEDRKYSRKYRNTILKGLQYVNSNLDGIDDIYALSIIATTLSKAKHNNTNKVIEKLQTYRKEDKNGLQWWTASDKAHEKDVEITAYVLMALLSTANNNFPIMKWLIEQRNARGGFKSTHDTVIGLEALVKFSQKYNTANNASDLKIFYSAMDHEGNEAITNEFLLQQDSALILQQHELPSPVRSVNFKVQGGGQSLLQLSYQYNQNIDKEFKNFHIKPKAEILNSNEMNLEICFSYQTQDKVSNKTNMVIMEVNLPTGYISEAESSQDLTENEFIQRIETRNEATTVILYFDKLSTEMSECINIEAYKTSEVMMPKPAAIVMYDYYNTSRLNTKFYTI